MNGEYNEYVAYSVAFIGKYNIVINAIQFTVVIWRRTRLTVYNMYIFLTHFCVRRLLRQMCVASLCTV